jgi:hypothetical protein
MYVGNLMKVKRAFTSAAHEEYASKRATPAIQIQQKMSAANLLYSRLLRLKV